MRSLAPLLVALATPAFASHEQLSACKKIDSDKTAAVYLIDARGALSEGPVDVGVISISKGLVTDQQLHDTPFRIVSTPKVVDFTDTCGQGICLKLNKVGRACKHSTVYSVQLAITSTGGPSVSPYSLNDTALSGFDFEAQENGYPAPVDYKFVVKLRGTLVTVP